ncbi:MAG: DUF255 domain-containing protein [Dokdonella sp.]
MITRFLIAASVLACSSAQAREETPQAGSQAAKPAIEWLRSEDAVFAQAKAEKRFVILDLEAVWCHWCHVMEEMTYANPQVIHDVQAHYVAWRVDQDSRPDLAQRYGDYGWPATIVFAADGTEIVKKRGYIPPEGFTKLLAAIVEDPSPIDYGDAMDDHAPAVSDSLDDTLRAELRKRDASLRDSTLGGQLFAQKFLDHDSLEYTLRLAADGDAAAHAQAKLTLDKNRALLDPAWGGFYQYSTDRDFEHPHFEKLGPLQGLYLRSYALGYAALDRDPEYAAVEKSVIGYLDNFLRSPDGAFYSSQDADLKPGEHSAEYFAMADNARRALGTPRVDKNIYASTNGTIIEGLATWAEASGDAHALTEAQVAARWIIAHRALDAGGFRHGEKDPAGPYLGDTLAMGRAFLALYRADADPAWLTRANAAARYIETTFRRDQGGYIAAVSRGAITGVPSLEENIALARWSNLLAAYSGVSAQTAMAKHAMRWLGSKSVALHNATQPGLLLIDNELARPPLHLTVVGAKDDPKSHELFVALQHLPEWYKRIDWWDRAAGPLPNPDVQYPPVKKPAAFVCTDRRCSLPLYDAQALAKFLVDEKQVH